MPCCEEARPRLFRFFVLFSRALQRIAQTVSTSSNFSDKLRCSWNLESYRPLETQDTPLSKCGWDRAPLFPASFSREILSPADLPSYLPPWPLQAAKPAPFPSSAPSLILLCAKGLPRYASDEKRSTPNPLFSPTPPAQTYCYDPTCRRFYRRAPSAVNDQAAAPTSPWLFLLSTLRSPCVGA